MGCEYRPIWISALPCLRAGDLVHPRNQSRLLRGRDSQCVRLDCALHSRTMNPSLKRALEIAVVPFAAAVVFVEQVLIRYLNRMMAAVARWPLIARLEAWLASLPPWAAVLAF